MAKLNIAMIGQKGIPARYGGVETHVEHLSTRLVEMGHRVTVFCRSRFIEPSAGRCGGEEVVAEDGRLLFRGVELIGRPSINTKHLDAATHVFICSMETALLRDYDLVHYHGIGPSAFAFIPRVAGKVVVSTLHALDWRQAKWSRAAGALMKAGEGAGMKSSTGIITVSRLLLRYVRERYGREARYIPNGAVPGGPRPVDAIRKWGLAGDDYVLAVGRIIPDRGLHHLVAAFSRLGSDLKLVIVGSENPRTEYSKRLESMAGGNVVFTGDVFGAELEELYANCRLYVLASSVEGLPITVCEAMSFARGMLLSDIPENVEVAGNAAVYFKCGNENDLYEKLKVLVEDREKLAALGDLGRERVRREYNWDRVAEETERFYMEILERAGRSSPLRGE